MKQKHGSGEQKGFTLIELLVVIAVIGTLAALVLVAMNPSRAKSRDTKRIADIQQISKAMETYFGDCGSYPMTNAAAPGITLGTTYRMTSGVNNANCTVVGNGTTTGGISTTALPGGATVSLNPFPTAPTPVDGGCTGGAGGTNNYFYRSYLDSANVTPTVAGNTIASGYSIAFCLGSTVNSYSAGAHTLTSRGIQ